MVKLTPDYYRLQPMDKMLYLAGAPLIHIKKKIDPTKFSFMPMSSEAAQTPIVISPQSQIELFNALHTNIATVGGSAVYTIGSHPTDQPGYDFLVYYCRTYQQYKFESKVVPKYRWINLATPDWDFLKSSEECELVVIHNISTESDQRRWDQAKDFLSRCTGCTTFVLIGSPNVLAASQAKLKILPDGAFQLGPTITRTFA